jgi:hypothetical protein
MQSIKNKTYTLKQAELNVRDDCDVLVVGGGTAGCVAALAAARSGAKTVLIEQLPKLGGTFCNGGIIALSFHSAYVSPDTPVKKIVKGIPEEFIDRLIETKGCSGYLDIDPAIDLHQNKYIVIPDHEIAPVVMAQMLLGAGVKIYLHTFLTDAQLVENHIKAAIIQSKSGREAIVAKQYVDCSGDGDLAYKVGCEYTSLYKNYIHTGNIGFIFGVGNVNTDEFIEFAKKNNLLCGASIFPGDPDCNGSLRLQFDLKAYEPLREQCKEYGIGGGFFLSRHRNCIDYINAIGLSDVNACDIRELSYAEMTMRIKAVEWLRFYKKNIPGFNHAFINWSSNQIGIRATRAFKCLYNLSNCDIVNSKRFNDEVGYFGYHDLAPIDKKYVLKGNGFYGIPYRALIPVSKKNLLVAGRMISQEYEAQMSTRNTVNCMLQGQAAGTAAALCSLNGYNPDMLPYSLLREKLLDGGVYFIA